MLPLMLQNHCPRCGKGKVFKHATFNVWRFTEMYSHCPTCDASFEPEPGFYFGAMFISYAISVAVLSFAWLITWTLFKPSTSVYIWLFLGSVLLATPFSYRYSRLLWLHWFGGHKRLP